MANAEQTPSARTAPSQAQSPERLRNGTQQNIRMDLDRWSIFTDSLSVILAYAASLWLRCGLPSDTPFASYIGGIFRHEAEIIADGKPSIFADYLDTAWLYLLPLMATTYFIYALHNLYTDHRFLRPRSSFLRIASSNIIILASVALGLFLFRNHSTPRSILCLFCILNTVFACFFRRVFATAKRMMYRHGRLPPRNALLFGNTPEAESIADIIDRRHSHGLSIALHGVLDLEALPRQVEEHNAKCIILADSQTPIDQVMKVLEFTRERNIVVKVVSSSLAILHLKADEPFDVVRGYPVVHFDPSVPGDESDNLFRRLVSRGLALFGLVVLAPVFGAIALLIKIFDPGPVFFRQERFGIDRRPFMLFKFRTMVVNAEALLATLEAQNEAGGGLFKLRNDPRVTRLGAFLRKTSLDELPQIYNVLRGEMRIVGPRPLPRRDLEHYSEEWHFYRHNGYPGLTCLWQISGRSDIDFNNMCILDVYYLRNRNWVLDLKIVVRTAIVMVFGTGAY